MSKTAEQSTALVPTRKVSFPFPSTSCQEALEQVRKKVGNAGIVQLLGPSILGMLPAAIGDTFQPQLNLSFDGSTFIDEGELYTGPLNPRSGLPHRGLTFTPEGGIRSPRIAWAHCTSLGEIQIPPLGPAWRFRTDHLTPAERYEFNRIVGTKRHTPVTTLCPLSADTPAVYLHNLPALHRRFAAMGSKTDDEVHPAPNKVTLNLTPDHSGTAEGVLVTGLRGSSNFRNSLLFEFVV